MAIGKKGSRFGCLADRIARGGAGEKTETCRVIAATVAMIFAISLQELRAPTRSRAPVAFARQVAMYVAHVAFGLPLSEVGRQFGRDRTTAGHACRRVEDRRDDPATDRMLAEIERAACAGWQAASRRLEASR